MGHGGHGTLVRSFIFEFRVHNISSYEYKLVRSLLLHFRKLNESQENIQYKDVLLQEQSAKLSLMDKSIKEQQLELKQKAVEVCYLADALPEVKACNRYDKHWFGGDFTSSYLYFLTYIFA